MSGSVKKRDFQTVHINYHEHEDVHVLPAACIVSKNIQSVDYDKRMHAIPHY